MDSGMWPMICKIDVVNSSHKRFPTIWSCDKHGTALQIRIVSRLRFCWRSWGLEVNLRWCLVHFWKQNICPSQFDVQETHCCLTQFYRVWDYYSGCPDYVWMGYLLLIFGTYWLKLYVQTKKKFNPIIRSSGNWRQLNPSVLATRKLGQFLILKPRTQLTKESRRLIKCLMWTTCPPTRILLKVKIRCTFVKTTRLWLRW